MKISVITISYNASRTIEETLASVRGQNYPEIEHIIIDGCSKDGTVEIIRRFEKDLGHWVSEPDEGIYHAMNKGISAATGEVIGFLNADDTYQGVTTISSVAAAFENEQVDSCYGDLVYVHPRKTKQVIRYWKSCRYQPGLFAKSWSPPHPTFFARRKIYENFGSFNLDYRLAADFELMLRFLEKNKISSVYIPEIMIRMKLGGATNNSLGNIINQNVEIIRSFKENSLHLSLPVFIANKAISRTAQFLHKKSPNPW